MFTQTYEVLVGYALGGTAAVVLFIILYRKANSVASSGNKAKMAGFSVMPAVLVILSIAAASAAFNYAIPRLQSAVTSAPVMGAVQAGGIAMQAIDSVLSAPAPSGGTGTVGSFSVQPMNVGGGSFQPIIPNSGWAGGALNSVAPGSMFVMPTVEPTQPAAAPAIVPTTQQVISYDGGGAYIVKSGDTLSKIAKQVYGNGELWPTICNANASILRGNCSNIMAGQRLTIPAPGTGDNRIVSNANGNAPANRQQNGQAFTATGQKYITALNVAQEQAAQEQNGRAVNEAGQQYISALNVAAVQPTPTPKKLTFFPTAVPGVAPTPHEFAVNPYSQSGK